MFPRLRRRVRFLGILLYDADRIQETASVNDTDLVEAQRAIIQDPFDFQVIAAAKANGISDAMIDSAQKSPVYKFVKQWKIALPLSPQFRTLPMLFYVPPLLPVLATMKNGHYEVAGAGEKGMIPLLTSLEQARIPLSYMAGLFAAGNKKIVEEVYRKLIAVRIYMRAKSVMDIPASEVQQALVSGGTTEEEALAIFQLTSRSTFEEHFVIPPLAREMNIETTVDPDTHKQDAGFGFRKIIKRRG